MKKQHTPGPWFTRGDTLDNTRAIEIEAELPSVGWTTLALVNDRALNCAHLPDGPNARLIAAAPDLLEALRRLVEACDHEKISGSQVTDAHAAIAKACGD